MRRMTVLACAALLYGAVALAGPPVPAMDAASHVQHVSASASGGYCSYVEPQQLYRCRSFSAWEQWDSATHARETRVSLDQYRSAPNLYAYRHVDCPVPRQALRVMLDKALVNATFDSEAPDCFAYGEMITFEPYSSVPWRYTGMQTLQADLLSPANQERRVTSYTSTDNVAGTSHKENCRGGAGYQPQAGGFTMIDLYRAFGPNEATGNFYFDDCGTTQK